jgi:flavin reductase (DIM6/NTAB) family NADH-FMN oxidoreductase RutF
VLSDSLAFLDCKVSSRLETPDHWIIYGIVENGNVSDLSCKTAVHHRKVANHY